MFILKGLLRAQSQEKILLYLLTRNTGYGKAIAEFYGISSNAVQKQLSRLEADGVVVSNLKGKLREYQLNPTYHFNKPLTSLLKAALAVYPPEITNRLNVQRTRPRMAGKPLVAARGCNV